MPATTWFHDRIANPLPQQADLVCDATEACHPTHGVFQTDPDGRNPTMVDFRRRGEFTIGAHLSASIMQRGPA